VFSLDQEIGMGDPASTSVCLVWNAASSLVLPIPDKEIFPFRRGASSGKQGEVEAAEAEARLAVRRKEQKK